MRAAAARSRTHGDEGAIIKAGELVVASYPDGAALSAAALKILVLMLHAAAGHAGEDRQHSIPKAVLRGTHAGTDRLRRVLAELSRAVLRVQTTSPHGKPAVRSVPLLTETIEEIADNKGATVFWRFSDRMREIVASSDHYAELQRQTVMALESRYAIRLYELGALYHRRADPVWRGTIDQLRELFGVPAGRLRRWADIRRVVVEAAIAEVNQLAPFEAVWEPVVHGLLVIGVQIHFWSKDAEGRAAAMKEVGASRVGRRARRDGTTQRMVDPALTAAYDALRRGEMP
jgi:hypothetical protein